MVGVSKSAVHRILTEILTIAKDECRVCSQRNENTVVGMFHSSVWRCFAAKSWVLIRVLLPWMKE